MSKHKTSNRQKQDVRKRNAALSGKKGDAIFVGLDVHKKKYHVAVWKNDRLAATWVMPADNGKVAEMLQPVRRYLKMAVYEAGPTGYGLARALMAARLPVSVCPETPTRRRPPSRATNSTCLP